MSLLEKFEKHSENMLREILEDLLQRKKGTIAEKYASSDTPFSDFIYNDEDYEKALDAFSTLSFYVSVCETVSAEHHILAFDVITESFKYSLATSLGTFKTLHKKGLHKCQQTLEDYRRNFYKADAVKVSRQDVSELLATHLAILSRTPGGDASLIHDNTGTNKRDE